MSRLSISLLRPRLLPSEVFLGWQSCKILLNFVNLTFHLIHPRNVLTTGNRLSVGVAEAVRRGKLTQYGVEWAITSEKAARRILLKLHLPFTKYDGTNNVGDSFAKLHFWVERHSLLRVKFLQYNIDFFTNFLLQ